MNEHRPIVPWEPKCYKYLSYMSHILVLKNGLFDERRILEKDLDQIKEHLGDPTTTWTKKSPVLFYASSSAISGGSFSA